MTYDAPHLPEEAQYQAIIRDLAVGMVSRVRDDHPVDYRRHLDRLTPEVLRDVAVFLAEMVPDTKTLTQLLRWKNAAARRAGKTITRRPFEGLAPCGTPAALVVHRENDVYCVVCENTQWHRENGRAAA